MGTREILLDHIFTWPSTSIVKIQMHTMRENSLAIPLQNLLQIKSSFLMKKKDWFSLILLKLSKHKDRLLLKQ